MHENKKFQPVLPAHWCIIGVMFALFAIYPLYIRNGYYGIDADKYDCLWIIGFYGIIAISIGAIIQCILYRIPKQVKSKLSLTDIFVIIYSILILISSIGSIDHDVAWYGYYGWFVGGIIILIFNILYFLISRFWRGDRFIIKTMLAVSAVVFLIGILNRFSIWPFEIPGGVDNYGFISTLGNVGWYNGYLTVVATVGVSMFVLKQNLNKVEHLLLGLYTFIVFMTGLSQGADTIFLYFLILFVGLLAAGTIYRDGIRRWLEMFILWTVAGQVLHFMRLVDLEWYSYDSVNLTNLFNNRYTTLWMMIPAVVLYILIRYRERTSRQSVVSEKETASRQRMTSKKETASSSGSLVKKIIRCITVTVIGLLLIWLVLAFLYTNVISSEAPELVDQDQISAEIFIKKMLYLDDDWGGGRGATIKAGSKLYSSLPLYRKMIGVGPDCFGSYAYEDPEIREYLQSYFGKDILCNAHCEPLTSLINIGLLGTLAYYGIFVTFLLRVRKMWKEDTRLLGIALAAVCFLTYNFINYSQILNFPFMFVLLAMGEAWMKQAEIKMGERSNTSSLQHEN